MLQISHLCLHFGSEPDICRRPAPPLFLQLLCNSSQVLRLAEECVLRDTRVVLDCSNVLQLVVRTEDIM